MGDAAEDAERRADWEREEFGVSDQPPPVSAEQGITPEERERICDTDFGYWSAEMRSVIRSFQAELQAAQERATEDARLIGSLTTRGARAEAMLNESLEWEAHKDGQILELTGELESAFAELDAADEREKALRAMLPKSPWDADQDCRWCTGHYDWHESDCPWVAAQRTEEAGE